MVSTVEIALIRVNAQALRSLVADQSLRLGHDLAQDGACRQQFVDPRARPATNCVTPSSKSGVPELGGWLMTADDDLRVILSNTTTHRSAKRRPARGGPPIRH
jgi:hypothetical protein